MHTPRSNNPHRIIVNADDFGLCESVNYGILSAHTAGNVSSATLMVNMPGTNHAIDLAHQNPKLGVGLHFCLTEGEALTGSSSLTDAAGHFGSRSTLILKALRGHLKLDDVQRELQAQLDKMRALGLDPSHCDSHQHILMQPNIFRAAVPIFTRQRLPLRIVNPPPAALRMTTRPVKAIKQRVNAWAAKRNRRVFGGKMNDYLVSVHDLPDLNDINAATYSRLEGVASTNNFPASIAGGIRLVGMPQKVLTSQRLRGKGIFGKLYWKTEEANRQRLCETFVTFTNQFSTPIFLEKFGYRRSASPDLLMLPALPGSIPWRAMPTRFDRFEATGGVLDGSLRFVRSEAWLRWRYVEHPKHDYGLWEIGESPDKPAGIVVLKRQVRSGVPITILMEFLPYVDGVDSWLMTMTQRLSLRLGTVGVLAMGQESVERAVRSRQFVRRKPGRFNYLVKGRTENETEIMSREKHSLSFGDTDFI